MNTATAQAPQTATVTTPTARPDASVARNLFFGEIVEENLFPFPQMRERDREFLAPMVEAISDFLTPKQDDFRRFDVAAEQPAEYVQALRDMGLFSLIIPEEHGGLGLSNAAYARVLSETSKHDSSTSLTIGAHSSIGMKGLLLFGTDEQKARYLPRLASGEMIAAFCLTEAGAGSDAASIRTKATRNDDGSWTLSGEKIWITNGGIAGFFTVFARTDSAAGKMSAFLVEASWPGVAHGPHEDKMGIRASATNTISFSDVRVPAENLLGEEGRGFKVAMAILNNGRTGLGGGAVGGMKTMIRMAVAQSQDRRQFGRSISEFGLIREKIAQMTVDCFAAESTVWMVAHYIDSGYDDYSTEAAISKVFASDAMQRAAHEALQIAGGNGFMRDFPYERATRDSRILSIFEGTNEILRLYIALQGLKDVGNSLKEVKSAVSGIFNDPIKGFGVLSGYAERRLARATGIGADRIVNQLHPRLRAVAQVYEGYTRKLSGASEELLRRHGKDVMEQQYALKRIGDLAIDLFVGLCVLSRAHAIAGSDPASAEEVITIAEVFTRQARRRMIRNIRGMNQNEDPALDRLAGSMLARGGYPWDVI